MVQPTLARDEQKNQSHLHTAAESRPEAEEEAGAEAGPEPADEVKEAIDPNSLAPDRQVPLKENVVCP